MNMTRIESELHDLYECLMRNDGMADHDTYNTIVGIANDVAEVEAENAKLREYATKLEMANLDVTARLTDYIGQYDPTDAFVTEVKSVCSGRSSAGRKSRCQMNDVKVFAKNLEESARLRSCLSDDAENARLIMGENEKLRELVRDMRGRASWQ